MHISPLTGICTSSLGIALLLIIALGLLVRNYLSYKNKYTPEASSMKLKKSESKTSDELNKKSRKNKETSTEQEELLSRTLENKVGQDS